MKIYPFNLLEIRTLVTETDSTHVDMMWILFYLSSYYTQGVKVKQSRYTPWRRLGGEEV
jgi:hypothetical protein